MPKKGKIAFWGGDRGELMIMEAVLAAGYAVQAFATPPGLLP